MDARLVTDSRVAGVGLVVIRRGVVGDEVCRNGEDGGVDSCLGSGTELDTTSPVESNNAEVPAKLPLA